MIRDVKVSDAKAIAEIYNEYILNTTISFETAPVSEHEMACRISEISNTYPYLVYENESGDVVGFCYAHKWKDRAAYNSTVETTIYCSQYYIRTGMGTKLMTELINECRLRGYVAMIACITGNNTTSINFHLKFGFKKVSHFKQVGIKFGQILDVVDYELLLK